jgi:hypothetical protein
MGLIPVQLLLHPIDVIYGYQAGKAPDLPESSTSSTGIVASLLANRLLPAFRD